MPVPTRPSPATTALPTPEDVEVLAATLRERVLVVEAPVHGDGFTVDLADADDLRALALMAGVVYLQRHTWGDYTDLDHDLHDRPLRMHADAGRLALVAASVLVGGALHTLMGVDPALTRRLEAARRRDEAEAARWKVEAEQHQTRLEEVVQVIANTYAGRLVGTEAWLRSSDNRNRNRLAREWATREFPDVHDEPRVKTAVLNATSHAAEVREQVVIPGRCAAFEADLERHAHALRDLPGFVGAGTKSSRSAMARRYMAQTDPLVPPALFVERLLAASS